MLIKDYDRGSEIRYDIGYKKKRRKKKSSSNYHVSVENSPCKCTCKLMIKRR